jgi:integrase/recombinase XerC
VKFSRAIDEYLREAHSDGRLNSPATLRSYGSVLMMLADDVSNRDPRTVGPEDIKRTLRRWPNPNTRRTCRSIIIAFFDFAVEEGWVKYNPARQTRRPKKQPTQPYRLNRAEVAAMLSAAATERERWAIHLGLMAGLRNAELRGLKGEHFQRPGFIWVSGDIAKGGKERWVPVIAELASVIAEIRVARKPDEYVLCAQRWRNPPANTVPMDLKLRPSSSQALRTLVMTVAARAGIAAHIHPHLMRHAFCDHVARFAGERMAQQLMGHADIKTTQIYMSQASPDDLAAALEGFGFELPLAALAVSSDEATTGIEPVDTFFHGVEPNLADWLAERAADAVALYGEHFSEGPRAGANQAPGGPPASTTTPKESPDGAG